MDKELRWRLYVNLRRDRQVPFATFNLTLLMIGVCLGCGTPSNQSAACPAIEVSVVADVQSDSTRPVTLNDGTTIQRLGLLW